METITIIVSIIIIVFGILEIILFFKIWGMCNNVSRIEQRLAEVFPTKNEEKHQELIQEQKKENGVNPTNIGIYTVGMKVCYPPMNRIMFIKELHSDGKIECVSYKKDGKEEFYNTSGDVYKEIVFKQDRIVSEKTDSTKVR